MVSWVLIFAALLLGFGVGLWCSSIREKNQCIGTLREDRSDPDEGPYLFLELDPGGLEKIRSSSRVAFHVELKNYIDSEGGGGLR